MLPCHRSGVCSVVYVMCLLCVFLGQPVCCLSVLFPSLCVNAETLTFLGVFVLCCDSCLSCEPCHCLIVVCAARITNPLVGVDGLRRRDLGLTFAFRTAPHGRPDVVS